jgi:hypothetical protein
MKKKAEHVLSDKELRHLEFCCMDMRQLALSGWFPLIICPYSALTYVLNLNEIRSLLSSLRSLLPVDGYFIVDCFVPHFDFLCLSDVHRFEDYRREIGGGLFLEREKRVKKNLTQQTNVITRRYLVVNPQGCVMKDFSTQETIRYFFHEELKLLLELSGMEIIRDLGDFEGEPYRYESTTMVLVCRKKGG